MKTPDITPGHISRAKDPAIVAESQNVKRTIGRGFLVLMIIASVWGVHSCVSSAKAKAKAEKIGMRNPTQCRNESEDWVTIPAGHYKDHAGDCLVGTPPPPPPGFAPVVRQFADCTTPCTMDIVEIRDIYTDGDPVYMLPPGWSRPKAILYSGKGHLIVQGGDIHSGHWEFWSADPKRVVLVRVFGKQ